LVLLGRQPGVPLAIGAFWTVASDLSVPLAGSPKSGSLRHRGAVAPGSALFGSIDGMTYAIVLNVPHPNRTP
jgi:hypothetical protein